MNNLFNVSFIFIVIIAVIVSIFEYSSLYDYSYYNINPDDILVSNSRVYLANS